MAKQEITEMLHRYCYAMDSNDRKLGYQVWHPDGTAHYEGMFEGLGRDFIDFGQSGHEAAFGGRSHQLTNILIEVEGDRATSRSCVTAAARMADSGGLYLIWGRFHDQWSRRDGVWRSEPALHHRTWQVVPTNHELSQSRRRGPAGAERTYVETRET